MRIVFVMAMVCVSGCWQMDRSTAAGASATQAPTIMTLTNLVYVDPSSANTQHPLVCGEGGDFPAGQELAFRDAASRETIHVVFPSDVKPPRTRDGKFVLHGRYQGIQNTSRNQLKRPSDDYRYFVVSSWEPRK